MVALAIHMYPVLQLMQAKDFAKKIEDEVLWMSSNTKTRTLKITPLENFYVYSSLYVIKSEKSQLSYTIINVEKYYFYDLKYCFLGRKIL